MGFSLARTAPSGQVQRGQPGIEGLEGAFGPRLSPGAFPAHLLLEGGDQTEVGLHGLEVPRICVRDVVDERAHHRLLWGRHRRLLQGETRGVDACQPAASDVTGITLQSGDLSGEEQSGTFLKLQRGDEKAGSVDVGVTVHRTVADELRPLQPRDEAEDPCLLAVLEVGLKADQVVEGASCVVLAQLDDGVGTSPRTWVA